MELRVNSAVVENLVDVSLPFEMKDQKTIDQHASAGPVMVITDGVVEALADLLGDPKPFLCEIAYEDGRSLRFEGFLTTIDVGTEGGIVKHTVEVSGRPKWC